MAKIKTYRNSNGISGRARQSGDLIQDNSPVVLNPETAGADGSSNGELDDSKMKLPPSIPVHPAAAMLPMMAAAELRALGEDIKNHGQKQPVIMHKGQILDGRNRFVACRMAGVEPTTIEWDGNGSALAFVMSANLHRRHLTESQRAMLAARAIKLLQEEVQGGLKLNSQGNLPANPPQGGRKRDHTAELFSVSPRSVSNAQRVLAQGTPELISAVEAGKVRVSRAATIAQTPAEQQQQALQLRPKPTGATSSSQRASRVSKEHKPRSGASVSSLAHVLEVIQLASSFLAANQHDPLDFGEKQAVSGALADFFRICEQRGLLMPWFDPAWNPPRPASSGPAPARTDTNEEESDAEPDAGSTDALEPTATLQPKAVSNPFQHWQGRWNPPLPLPKPDAHASQPQDEEPASSPPVWPGMLPEAPGAPVPTQGPGPSAPTAMQASRWGVPAQWQTPMALASAPTTAASVPGSPQLSPEDPEDPATELAEQEVSPSGPPMPGNPHQVAAVSAPTWPFPLQPPSWSPMFGNSHQVSAPTRNQTGSLPASASPSPKESAAQLQSPSAEVSPPLLGASRWGRRRRSLALPPQDLPPVPPPPKRITYDEQLQQQGHDELEPGWRG